MTHMYINIHFMRYKKIYVICKYIHIIYIYIDSMYMHHMSYRNIFVAHLPTFLSINLSLDLGHTCTIRSTTRSLDHWPERRKCRRRRTHCAAYRSKSCRDACEVAAKTMPAHRGLGQGSNRNSGKKNGIAKWHVFLLCL